jgi:hypothetical protein
VPLNVLSPVTGMQDKAEITDSQTLKVEELESPPPPRVFSLIGKPRPDRKVGRARGPVSRRAQNVDIYPW